MEEEKKAEEEKAKTDGTPQSKETNTEKKEVKAEKKETKAETKSTEETTAEGGSDEIKTEEKEQEKVEIWAPCWGKDSVITVIFDTDRHNGHLSFKVDGELLKGVEIKNVFVQFGNEPVYPAISLCPLSGAEVELKADTEEKDEGEDAEQALLLEHAALLNMDPEVLADMDEVQREALVRKVKEAKKNDESNIPGVLLLSDVAKQPQKAAEVKEEAKEEAKEEKQKAEGGDDDDEDEEKEGAEPVEQKKAKPAAATTESDAVAVDKIRWMWETDNGWEAYTVEISKQLEDARRKGQTMYSVNTAGDVKNVRLKGTDLSQTSQADSKKRKVRRHVIGDGLAGQWEMMSSFFNPPRSMRGSGAATTMEKIWANNENMQGRKCGLGFLFLYVLFQGQMKVKVVSSGWGNWWGGWGAKKNTTNDSHRFAVLAAQLFADRSTKSVASSIVNVLSRNKRLCPRLPRFRDTRKIKNVNVFNGWVDEREPQSPLSQLFSQLVPIMQSLKKKKGVVEFPPPPPHPEMALPPDHCFFPVTNTAATEVKDVSSVTDRRWMRPELTNVCCDHRELSNVSNEKIVEVARKVQHHLGGNLFSNAKPPVTIESKLHFDRVMKIAASSGVESRLVVVDFFAEWCGPCKALNPMLQLLAKKFPVVQFLKVDIDNCDGLAKTYAINKLPTIKFFRGGSESTDVLGTITGGGPQFLAEFLKAVPKLLTPAELKLLSSQTQQASASAGNWSTNEPEITLLSECPLNDFAKYTTKITREQQNRDAVSAVLPFNIDNHDFARTAVAKSMLARMKDDISAWAHEANNDPMLVIKGLYESSLREFFANQPKVVQQMNQTRTEIQTLLEDLRKSRDKDAALIQDIIPLFETAFNYVDIPADVDLNDKQKAERLEKIKFLLRRQSGQESVIWLEFIFGSLLSSHATADLKRLNPYLDDKIADSILNVVSVSLLKANRVGHANRCIAATLKLLSMVDKVISLEPTQRSAKQASLLPSLLQASQALADNLVSERHYIAKNIKGSYEFDPRYLIFEFTWNILLRKKQVEIVKMFTENLVQGRSKVKQMIMGAGKTTVVAPLLALMLADGKSLVINVIPRALLEMSRKRMRETFATIIQKRIYTLKFDRSTVVRPSMAQSLQNSVRNRGIVCTTPTAIKSVMLNYIELLGVKKDAEARGLRSKVKDLELQCVELGKILNIFRNGVMLLDEVDLILHPLKSELNFPTGEKYDLDVTEAGERWDLPMHLLDAIFFASLGKISTFEQRGNALDIVRRLSTVIKEGYAASALQRLPHITLLNPQYFNEKVKPIMAEWAYLWLEKHHLHGIDRDETLRYLLEGATARSVAKTKANLIDLAIIQAEVELGERDAAPPTESHLNVLTTEERELLALKADTMKRQKSDFYLGDLEKKERLATELSHLRRVHKNAEVQQILVDKICDLDFKLEAAVADSANNIKTVDDMITKLKKTIEELEFPRDDSLDNAVVVWLSAAFAVRSDAAGSVGGSLSVHSITAKLEDAGYTIRRCDVQDEAVDRLRELQLSGRLRCVIVGGGESAGCGPTCTMFHGNSKCFRCFDKANTHLDHNCADGNRGSFPIQKAVNKKEVKTINPLECIKEVTNPESLYAQKYGALPASRVVVYAGQTEMKERDRMACWYEGALVFDKDDDLEMWVRGLEEWPDAGKKQQANNSVESLLEECKFGDDGDDDETISLAPATMKRQQSAGTLNLGLLRDRVEQLEAAKLSLFEKESETRKKISAEIEAEFSNLQKQMVAEQNILSGFIKKATAALKKEKVAPLVIDPYKVGPAAGRDAALAMARLDRLFAEEKSFDLNKVRTNLRQLQEEKEYLDQTILAAKVVARVPTVQKKFLNLTSDWLRTFMVHCLGKINRVSFGLLNDDECSASLAIDPLMPPSRLKLAVPFVGKDVPSPSSEFAHPDVVIGATILAYRYSGLRRADFNDLVDSLTTEYLQEIGPPRERASSRRHENWVLAAGGRIRGVKTVLKGVSKDAVSKNAINKDRQGVTSKDIASKNAALEAEEEIEVVQLKYLQRSNQEQMDKLYTLLYMEPQVIHYYLNKFIFPSHMRSQRQKLSSSGQAVGGDMLVGRRLGFSGTPSDLLPKELGVCDYETGDDGKMLTTVLDPHIASHEYLPSDWHVEYLLSHIANADPPFHALIDTGALITGYSNKEVAIELLKRGLPWCDGIVFLDDQDKQQVLIRATWRDVPADQCGIPLERRFAFYDQIHTTGMDIKHIVNARAVITLGKDMVFRDYVQGAFRMRGIGVGQQITIFIIPEVAELMVRQLRGAVTEQKGGTSTTTKLEEIKEEKKKN